MEQNIYINTYNKIFLKPKIINYYNKKGLKEVAENNLFKTCKVLNKDLNKDISKIVKCLVIKNSLFFNIKIIEKKKKIFKEIPYFLKPKLRIFYAIKQILEKSKKKKNIIFNISNNIINQLTKKHSSSLKNKKESYKIIFSKRTFTHFRWF